MQDTGGASPTPVCDLQAAARNRVGVLFMTLEDEAGFVNLVVLPGVFQR